MTAAAGWAGPHFYDYFLFTGDEVFLRNRAVPWLKDVAVCCEVLSNLIDGCQRLSIERESVDRWRAMLARLPDYEINDDGAIKEWLHPAFKDNYHHRHQSHLYPLFPGLEITEESHPDLYEACRVAVEKRLVIGLTSQTGWSMAHMA